MAEYQEVLASELGQTFAKDRERYVWIDVRTEKEYQEGHIPGAIHIPHDQIEERIEELNAYERRPFLLICRSGVRSVKAIEILAQKGFTQLYNLKGGMLEWTGPVVKS